MTTARVRPRRDLPEPTLAECFIQLQTTVDDREEADRLVRDVVERRLAACGQVVGPIRSTYWWRGGVEAADEWLILFKTRASLGEELAGFIREQHPYDLPEIITFEVRDASSDYAAWIAAETDSADR